MPYPTSLTSAVKYSALFVTCIHNISFILDFVPLYIPKPCSPVDASSSLSLNPMSLFMISLLHTIIVQRGILRKRRCTA